ncbi:hypothetical protein MYAM1_002205 [Malassezia yamatoensis]|uniref:ELYS-like domain-containing protein n=1 Tax=Malassezia yamatoensis TaxID=253288 RepID=A0AAJ6CJ28_9BASI|nr:hypothetical protein MYAM1_002205 [Malassezia yamatoensis]
MQDSFQSAESFADVLLQTYLASDSQTKSEVWTPEYAADVQQRRDLGVDKKLLYDRLLMEAGIDRNLFPPTSPSDTYVLLVAILTASLEESQKHALVYYLCLESDHYGAHDSQASRLAEYLPVSPALSTEIEGYWTADHGDFSSAVCQLRGATLLPVVAEMMGNNPQHAFQLLQLYDIQGAIPMCFGSPSDTSVKELKLILLALARVRGIGAAWRACRTWLAAQPQQTYLRKSLFDVLLSHCFAPKNSDAIRELLSFPLNKSEEEMIQDLALQPQTFTNFDSAVMVDTLLLKFVNEGRYVDAIHLDRRAAPIQRANRSHGDEKNTLLRHQRKHLMDGVWSLLPPIQRDTLTADLGYTPSTNEQDLTKSQSNPTQSTLASSTASQNSPSQHAFSVSVHGTSPGPARKSSTASIRDNPSPLRSNSPFAGWKRTALNQVMPSQPVNEPQFRLPIPKPSINTPSKKPMAMDESASPEDHEDQVLDASLESETMEEDIAGDAQQEDELYFDQARQAESQEESLAQSQAYEFMSQGTKDMDHAPTEESGSESEPTSEHQPWYASQEVPRRRRGTRRAAQRANVALRQVLRPSDEPTIPGGFPMQEDGPELASEPNSMSPPPTRRRSRRSSHAKEEAVPWSMSMSSMAPKAKGRIRRSTTQADVSYPQASLARLEALHDARPIARRTRAQTAELESHGSQASDGETPKSTEELSLRTPSKRRTRRSSPQALSTPQQVTRSGRRLRNGVDAMQHTPGTPRSVGRRRN